STYAAATAINSSSHDRHLICVGRAAAVIVTIITDGIAKHKRHGSEFCIFSEPHRSRCLPMVCIHCTPLGPAFRATRWALGKERRGSLKTKTGRSGAEK